MPQRKWTDEQLIEAVASSVNYGEVARELGLARRNYNVRKHIQRLSLSTEHFTHRASTKTWKEKDFPQIVASSTSLSEVVRKLGLADKAPGNRRTIKKYIDKFDLNTDHFTGSGQPKEEKDTTNIWQPPLLEEVLVESSNYNNHSLKKRLLKAGYLSYQCYECKISEWRGKPLSLHLHHINGIHNDNRLDNLTLLCPNCHIQLHNEIRQKAKITTIAKPIRLPKNKCSCGKFKGISSKQCISCANSQKKPPTKIQWPTKEELEKLLWQSPTQQLALQLGVSDKAVEKRAKKLGLSKPPRGYWQKKTVGSFAAAASEKLRQ
jgi:biotin operon repressor